jgi:hypothetical protein
LTTNQVVGGSNPPGRAIFSLRGRALKTSLIVKINFLVLGLIVVLMTMSSLKKNGLPPALRELFSPSEVAGQAAPTRKLSWCETRVAALISPNKFKLENVKMKWFVEDKDRREVNGLAVEKWFGRYCAVRGEVLAASGVDLNGFAPVLFVKFVTDQVEALGRNAEGTFLWRGQPFKSAELTEALNELGQLAQAH